MIVKPNYQNSITNLSNSLLKRFGASPYHSTIKCIDEILAKKKRVVVFLFDGMGKYVLEKHLKENSFFRSHIICDIASTMPPTTVASTNSFLSGLYPEENGWLGWSQYFKKNDKIINVFTNYIEGENRILDGENYMEKIAPYPSIADLINQKHRTDIAKLIFGYPVDKENKKVRKVKSFIKYAYKEATNKKESFTYAYWCSPDCYMHKDGTSSIRVHHKIKQIQRLVKKYANKHPDVLTLVIADHGMKDVKFDALNNYPDLMDTLLRPITLEKRCANFYIKSGREKEFEYLFDKYYGKHYKLFTVEEAIKQKFFGEGKISKLARNFLGEYIAIAGDEYSLDYQYDKGKEKVKFKGHHAGGTLDEMMISIIGINAD